MADQQPHGRWENWDGSLSWGRRTHYADSMQVVVLSVNLQNFYGDASFQTYASRGKNQTHIVAAEVMAQAKHYGADVICTQEDEHGLALSEFDEVASACKHGHRGKAVVRTYVRADWHRSCSFAVVQVPKS